MRSLLLKQSVALASPALQSPPSQAPQQDPQPEMPPVEAMEETLPRPQDPVPAHPPEALALLALPEHRARLLGLFQVASLSPQFSLVCSLCKI